MATIGEANAAATVLRWLGYRDGYATARPVPLDEEAADALVLLAEKAGKALQLTYDPAEVRRAVTAAGVRLRGEP